MLIVVKVVGGVSGFVEPPGANRPGPGHRFFFSDNLVLEEIDGKKPGPGGLPREEKDRRAGTQSGFITTVRKPDPTDPFVAGGNILLQYDGTYWLNAVAGLQEGQITARGVVLKKDGLNVGIPTFAITGGTKAYATARGQVTEKREQDKELRLLDIVL
jgi:hypothetical protein